MTDFLLIYFFYYLFDGLTRVASFRAMNLIVVNTESQNIKTPAHFISL